jgi:hypothetical protein
MSAGSPRLHGVAAMFETPEALLRALRALRKNGYERLEVYTPWPLEEARELLPHRRSRVPLIMLVAGAAGCTGAVLLQMWAATDYPLNVAGRPLFSWPAFVPVTFELTVLTASLCGLLGFLGLARLPRLDHPMFAHRTFVRASQDAFFVCVRADDARFHAEATPRRLQELGGDAIEEVRA